MNQNLLILIALLTSACGTSSVQRKQPEMNGAQSSGKGSCTNSDPSGPNLKFCYENESDSAQQFCKIAGGSWTSSKCDASKYARRCNSSMSQSINDGPVKEIKETYYFQSASKTPCMGTESKTSDAEPVTPATASGEQLKSGDQIMSDAEVRTRLANLPTRSLAPNMDIVWGGIAKQGQTLTSKTLDIPLQTAGAAKIVVVALATTSECLKPVGMGLSYAITSSSGSMKFGSHYISDGMMQPVGENTGKLGTLNADVTGTVRVLGTVEPRDYPMPAECPFLAVIRLEIEKIGT